MHLAVALLVRVVDDALFVREIHRPRPTAEVVDDRQSAASACLTRGRLLASEVHPLVAPFLSPRFVAMRACLFLECAGHATLLRSLSLLFLGERHTVPSVAMSEA